MTAKRLVVGVVLGWSAALLCACATPEGSSDGAAATSIGGQPAASAKPNHRQYFDQRQGRYYYFDQKTHSYYWEDGTPRY